MLSLGRLDGRLNHSPCADIFLARARLAGTVALAGLAGVPVRVEDLQNWIAGRSPPPRSHEGLNDPISLTSIFHIALLREEQESDPIAKATLNTLRTIIDDRTEAETYGPGDLAHFGPMWRQIRAAASAPFVTGDLIEVAERIFAVAALTEEALPTDTAITTIDGRTLNIAPKGRDRNWLIGTAVPLMLRQADFTSRIIASMIVMPKFLPPSPAHLAIWMEKEIGRLSIAGLVELTELERLAASMLSDRDVTRRSKVPLLDRLLLAYPGLQPPAIARLLQVTPQGARKLLRAAQQANAGTGKRQMNSG